VDLPTTGPLRHDESLGRRTRAGSLASQAKSTHSLIRLAAEEGRGQDAAELARYSVDEMAEAAELFPVFASRARGFLHRGGVPFADIDAAMTAERAGTETEMEMVTGRRRRPAAVLGDAWRAYLEAVDDFAAACVDGRPLEAMSALEDALDAWRQAHDRACDEVAAYAGLCAQLLGEDSVGELWDAVMADFYPTRDRFDVDRRPWSESFALLATDTAETFRGHLSGPGRCGEIEVAERSDRIVFRFSPCGTGGRLVLADDPAAPDAKGAASSSPPPASRRVTARPHPWSWGKAGVCLYCVHCCQLQERVPIARLGYPLRVVEPPTRTPAGSEARCTWTIYRDPASVPPEAYARVGKRKPAVLGSKAVQQQRPHQPPPESRRPRPRP
jgi:hypothetical protein